MAVIRRITPADESRVAGFWREQWHSEIMLSRDRIYRPAGLDGFVALDQEQWIGLVTFSITDQECEIVSLDSLQSGRGIGTALIEAAKREAQRGGCRRVFLITTNDNLNALRFYQKRGFELVTIYRNEMERVRRHKPHVPLVGLNGIPLRDEIELELPLKPAL